MKKMDKTNQILLIGRLIPDSGKTHQNQKVYSTEGKVCSLKGTDYKNPPKVLVERVKI